MAAQTKLPSWHPDINTYLCTHPVAPVECVSSFSSVHPNLDVELAAGTALPMGHIFVQERFEAHLPVGHPDIDQLMADQVPLPSWYVATASGVPWLCSSSIRFGGLWLLSGIPSLEAHARSPPLSLSLSACFPAHWHAVSLLFSSTHTHTHTHSHTAQAHCSGAVDVSVHAGGADVMCSICVHGAPRRDGFCDGSGCVARIPSICAPSVRRLLAARSSQHCKQCVSSGWRCMRVCARAYAYANVFRCNARVCM